MYITNKTNEYDNITSTNYTEYDNMTLSNCTIVENVENKIIFKYLLLSIPNSIFLFSLISFMVYTSNELSLNNK